MVAGGRKPASDVWESEGDMSALAEVIQTMREADYTLVRAYPMGIISFDVWMETPQAQKHEWIADAVNGLLQSATDATFFLTCLRNKVFCVLPIGAAFKVNDLKAPMYMCRGTWIKQAATKWLDAPGWRKAAFDVNARRDVDDWRGDDHDMVWVNAYYRVEEVDG